MSSIPFGLSLLKPFDKLRMHGSSFRNPKP